MLVIAAAEVAVGEDLALGEPAAARDRLAAAGATILERPWGGWDFADPEGNVVGVAAR